MKLTFKEVLLRFVFLLGAVLVFTFFDWIVHSSWSYLEVPGFYFMNKIIYGTLIAFLASLAFRKPSIPKQAAIITLVTVGLLQVRYILYGYTLLFHVIIVAEHLFFMFFSTWGALKLLEKVSARR